MAKKKLLNCESIAHGKVGGGRGDLQGVLEVPEVLLVQANHGAPTEEKQTGGK